MQSLAKTSWKTICDRFEKLSTDRRIDEKRNAVAPGISEDHGEKEQLLDDFIQQIDEWQEAGKVEKEERTTKEKRLIEAGEEMRERALN